MERERRVSDAVVRVVAPELGAIAVRHAPVEASLNRLERHGVFHCLVAWVRLGCVAYSQLPAAWQPPGEWKLLWASTPVQSADKECTLRAQAVYGAEAGTTQA